MYGKDSYRRAIREGIEDGRTKGKEAPTGSWGIHLDRYHPNHALFNAWFSGRNRAVDNRGESRASIEAAVMSKISKRFR